VLSHPRRKNKDAPRVGHPAFFVINQYTVSEGGARKNAFAYKYMGFCENLGRLQISELAREGG
jgi:hypothetical protein